MLRRIIALHKQAGGEEFSVVIWVPDIARAFRKAKEQAEADVERDREDDEFDEDYEDDEDDEDGGRTGGRTASYSGTILEKDSYKIVNSDPVSEREAHQAAKRDVDDNDKFGPAFARALTKRLGPRAKIDGWLFYGIASS